MVISSNSLQHWCFFFFFFIMPWIVDHHGVSQCNILPYRRIERMLLLHHLPLSFFFFFLEEGGGRRMHNVFALLLVE